MIKVTIEQVLKINPILSKLATQSYAGRVAFALARLAREVAKEVEVFDNTRMELVKKYADKDEGGEVIVNENGNVHITDENLACCNKELNEVLVTEIELNANKMPIGWFENIELTIEEALALEVFVS